MALVTHPGDGLDCEANINATANIAGVMPATVELTNAAQNGISSTWIIKSDVNDANKDNANALGAVEMGDSVLVLNPGVIVRAKSNSFAGTHQCAFRWKSRTNVGITFGAGSSIYGRKEDQAAAFEQSHGALFLNCTNVNITGTNEVHLKNWHGDGCKIGSGDFYSLGTNTNVNISDVTFSDNHRNGLTINDVDGCNILRCEGYGNTGANPRAYLVIEPAASADKLINLVVEGGQCEGISYGVVIALTNLITAPSDISITLRNIRSMQTPLTALGPWGFAFITGANSTVGGTIDCYNLVAERLASSGFYFDWRLTSLVQLRMHGCVADRCSLSVANTPYNFVLTGAPSGGGITFDDCSCVDTKIRNPIGVSSSGGAATNVIGSVRLKSRSWPVRYSSSLLPNLKIGRFGRLQFSNSAKSRRSAQRGER